MKHIWNRRAVLPLLALLALLLAACSGGINVQGPAIDTTPGGSTPTASSTGTPPASRGSMTQIIPSRTGAAMAYDAQTKQVVLFGGDALNDTWAWDGHTWTQLFPASSPPTRRDASMVYDAVTKQIILFGGIGVTGTALDDTWAWDGTNWTPLSSAVSPPARAQASMVYDAQHQQIVLFGGMVMGKQNTSSVANDTWIWDGKNQNWQVVHPATVPPARAQASMAYDAAHRQTLLFGGTDGKSVLNDTWAWNGTNWQQLHPATAPSARVDASMAYDASTQQTVLFAGVRGPGANATNLSDMWIWNGSNWAQHTTSSSPGGPYTVAVSACGASGQHIVCSAKGQDIVVYAVQMQNKTVSASQTWLWNGTGWSVSQ
jgi:hypothetical protein